MQMNSRPALVRAMYRSLLRASLKYQKDYQEHGSVEQLIRKATKAFFPFNRSELPDSRLDSTFASTLGDLKDPREHIRPRFEEADGSQAKLKYSLHIAFQYFVPCVR